MLVVDMVPIETEELDRELRVRDVERVLSDKLVVYDGPVVVPDFDLDVLVDVTDDVDSVVDLPVDELDIDWVVEVLEVVDNDDDVDDVVPLVELSEVDPPIAEMETLLSELEAAVNSATDVDWVICRKFEADCCEVVVCSRSTTPASVALTSMKAPPFVAIDPLGAKTTPTASCRGRSSPPPPWVLCGVASLVPSGRVWTASSERAKNAHTINSTRPKNHA